MATTNVFDIQTLEDLCTFLDTKTYGDAILEDFILEGKLKDKETARKVFTLEMTYYLTHYWPSENTQAIAKPSAEKSAELLLNYLEGPIDGPNAPEKLIKARKLTEGVLSHIGQNPYALIQSKYSLDILFIAGIKNAINAIKGYTPYLLLKVLPPNLGITEDKIKQILEDNNNKAISIYKKVLEITNNKEYRTVINNIGFDDLVTDRRYLDEVLALGIDVNSDKVANENGRFCRRYIISTKYMVQQIWNNLTKIDEIIQKYVKHDDKSGLEEIKGLVEDIEFLSKKYERKLEILTNKMAEIPGWKTRARDFIQDHPLFEENYPLSKMRMHNASI